MYVKRNSLGTTLLSFKYDLKVVQSILELVKYSGSYEDDNILIVTDKCIDGYYVEQKTT